MGWPAQNEYGAKIAGPLPRSFMRGQWELQKQILQRSRSLGMSAQLPGTYVSTCVRMSVREYVNTHAHTREAVKRHGSERGS
jgi:hypothetical protein